MEVYNEKIKLMPQDVNIGRKITNYAILKIFENIATHQSDDAGYGVCDTEKNGVTWILLDWKMEVKKRTGYKDELTAYTWPRTLDRFYSYRDFELYNDENELIAIGTSKWLLFDIKKGRIARISDEVKNAYSLIDRNVFGEESLEKMEPLSKSEAEITFVAMRRDIDFNGHVHNLNYLDFAYEALPREIYENSEMCNVRITYLKEIKVGEGVKCKYLYEDGIHKVTICSSDEKTVNAIVQLW